jgi:ATPase subunit of ABC transporter with duplicated ATPase domains
MSATMHASGLSAGHGDRTVFSGVDLVVSPGDVVGLVGANGAGKSTLLRLLAGLDEAQHGSVKLNPPTATVGYLPQEPDRIPGETVAAFLARRTGVHHAQTELDAATAALAAGGDEAEQAFRDDAYALALERWLALGAPDLEERADQVRLDVGLDAHPATTMTTLSGGQAARAGLASLLLSRYDVYLLDEPTNDLDLDGLARLEGFVSGLRAGVVLVSHDREFLIRTVTTVVELDLSQQRVSVFGGGYDAYRQEREVARRHARDAYEEYAGTRAGLQERARTQRNWMEKGVRNARRKAADNDKFVKRFRAESSEKQAAKARQTDRMIERLEVVEEPRKEWRLNLEIALAPRAGAVVAVLNGAVAQRTRSGAGSAVGGADGAFASRPIGRDGAELAALERTFRLGPVDLQIDWADRVAVVGPNGSGKSTLLALLLGRLAPIAGTSSLGPGVVVGEIDQARSLFTGEVPLARAFGELLPTWPDADVRTLLAKFGLGARHVLRPAATLSPGERTRAALALLQARGVNLLVLDEPTNHLDLPAIEQLEQALDSFHGTLLLVSHDRRLLDAVRVNRRLEVTARDGRGTVRELPT